MNIIPYTDNSEPEYAILHFKDYDVWMIDIDIIFKKTNQDFSDLVTELGLDTTFDFSKRDNKKLYTHTFLKSICNQIREMDTKLCFYSNSITKDTFREKLINKVKTIFGFRIYQDVRPLKDILRYLQDRDSNYVGSFEVFLETEPKRKQFKKIKEFLIKSGLTNLNEEFFEDLKNKMLICS